MEGAGREVRLCAEALHGSRSPLPGSPAPIGGAFGSAVLGLYNVGVGAAIGGPCRQGGQPNMGASTGFEPGQLRRPGGPLCHSFPPQGPWMLLNMACMRCLRLLKHRGATRRGWRVPNCMRVLAIACMGNVAIATSGSHQTRLAHAAGACLHAWAVHVHIQAEGAQPAHRRHRARTRTPAHARAHGECVPHCTPMEDRGTQHGWGAQAVHKCTSAFYWQQR